MEKQKRINWILVITGVLIFISMGVFAYKLLFEKTMTSCLFEGGRIEYGKEVLSSDGSKCICGDGRKVVCKQVREDEAEKSFSTENLEFKYSYLNTLSENFPDQSRVLPIDINQNGEELTVIFEREGLCNEDFEAPNQAGYYEEDVNKLVLSIITSGDEEKFKIPCLMSNSFKITDFSSEGRTDFEIFYRNEKGQEFNLMACSYNGVMYGDGDVFAGGANKPVCRCEKGEVVCE